MSARRLWVGLVSCSVCAVIGGCAGARGGSRATVAPRAVTRASATVANEARFPSRGCTPNAPAVAGFVAQAAALDALETAADLPANDATRSFEDGPVRAEIASSWWPARVDGRDFTAYRLLTGDDSDVVSVYLGDRPAFRAPGGHEFRLVNAGTLVRGTLSRQDRRWRLEALALLPCATPRHVHVSARSDDPRVIARVARALRSLRVVREGAARVTMVTLDATRDRARVESLVQAAPEAVRGWVLGALSSGSLRAQYPLSVDHPLADQSLTASVATTVRGVSSQLWLSLAVRAGAVQVGPVFSDAASRGTDLSAVLRASSCGSPSLTIAQDGVALRCAGEPEWRAATHESDGAEAMLLAFNRAVNGRSFVRRWGERPALAWGYPSTLCAASATDPVVISRAGAAITIRAGRCLLVKREEEDFNGQSALLALAAEGACADVEDAPWSRSLRGAGRFSELSGREGQGACRFTVGLRAGRGWVVSTNDSESAAGPVGQGLGMGVAREAIARAVGVAIELAAMSGGRREDVPEGVSPTVLARLGLDRAGTAAARDTSRWWYAFGGVDGALPVALLDASATASDRARVVFAPWTFDLARGADGAWTVTQVERTAW